MAKTLRVVLPALWLAAVVAIAAGLGGLRFDSDAWLSPDHPLERQLDFVGEEFEEGETLLLIVPLAAPFFSTPDIFPALRDLEDRLGDIRGVQDTRSPLSAKTVTRRGASLQVRSFANGLDEGVYDTVADMRDAFRQSPYNGRVLSADGMTLGVRIRTDTRNRAEHREAVISAIEAHIRNSPFADAALAGDTALKAEINRAVRDQLPVLLAIGAAVIFIFLFLFYRNVFQVTVLMACLFVAVGQCLAVINVLGHSLTPVSIALPLLVSVIVIADGMHIFAIWEREAAAGAARPLAKTMAKTWLPCLMTSLTSAVGFGAFFVSDLTPVRNFGIDAFVAIVLVYPLLLLIVWGALALFPARLSAAAGRGGASAVERAALAAMAWRGKTALLFAAAAAALAWSLKDATAETNFLRVLFKEESAVSRAFDAADNRLGGSGAVEVLINGGGEGYFQSMANFTRAQELTRRLGAHESVNHADSYLLPLQITHRALGDGDGESDGVGGGGNDGAGADGDADSLLPRNAQELAQEIFFLELSRGEQGDDLLGPYLNFTGDTARMEAQTPNLPSSRLDTLIAFMAAQAKEVFPDARVTITGSGHYVNELSRYVITTQLQSIALTFAVIGLVFIFLFGIRLGAAGLVANLFPLLAATGAMCLLRVPFDFATVLVTGVTLGLSVDDSIHFLHHYKREAKTAACRQSAIDAAMRLVARPIVITSLLFCLSLAVFLSSSLVVMVKFATFTIIGLAAAMFAAVMLLPWLVEAFTADTTRLTAATTRPLSPP